MAEETLGKRYLIPTAEAPVANLHRGEILSETDLPKSYCAYSLCFARKPVRRGVATRGMIRALIRQGGANQGGEAGRRL